MNHELNIGTIGGMTTEEILTMMKLKGIGEPEVTSDRRDNSDIITGDIILGEVVQMAGTEWRVIHLNETLHQFYMIKEICETKTIFRNSLVTNSFNNTRLEDSNPLALCDTYYESLPDNVKSRLLMQLDNYKVITKRCMLARDNVTNTSSFTYDYDYFNGNEANRIAFDRSGNAVAWWVDGRYTGNNNYYVRYMNITGSTSSINVTDSAFMTFEAYFRPVVCLPL